MYDEVWPLGTVNVIKGLSGRWVRVKGPDAPPETSGGLNCPCCGGFGITWAGWFNCELCPAKWLWQLGEVFVPEGWRAGESYREQRDRSEAALSACWRH